MSEVRKFTSKQMGDACEMLVAAELTLAGVPALMSAVDSGDSKEIGKASGGMADSLGGGIGLDNRISFDLCRALLDEVILLSEAEIAAGMRHIHAATGDPVEGAAAVGVAALLAGKIKPHGPIVAILSGCNVAPDLFARVLCRDPELEAC